MGLSVEASPDNKMVTVTIDGRFDFTLYRAFRDAYTPYKESGTTYVLDLAKADYMDSSALGMLLQLREHAGGETAKIRIINCRPSLTKILKIANFQRMFAIEATVS
jgi:HptB-dependent secretion and biofilm anti anti-sigma factor